MLSNTPPCQYIPGYVAFPNRIPFNIFEREEAKVLKEHEEKERFKAEREQEERERVEAAKKAAKSEWQRRDAVKQARLESIREAALRAEIEWLRMGGRISLDNPGDAELRKKYDEEATLTSEERTLKRAWEKYDKEWEMLAISIRPTKSFTFRKISFTFLDVPWPILRDTDTKEPLRMELGHLTTAAIERFLLHPLRAPCKSRRDKLRDAVLRFHPDKFSRYLHRIVEEDRARVQEGVIIVTKCLNELMGSEP